MLSGIVALFLLPSYLVFEVLHLEEESGGQNYVNETNCLGLHQPCVTIPPYNSCCCEEQSFAVLGNINTACWENLHCDMIE